MAAGLPVSKHAGISVTCCTTGHLALLFAKLQVVSAENPEHSVSRLVVNSGNAYEQYFQDTLF